MCNRDLRGNPLTELEITRSDLKNFRSWAAFLPSLEQKLCKHSVAKTVLVLDAELCVLEGVWFYLSLQEFPRKSFLGLILTPFACGCVTDADFERIYGSPSSSGFVSTEEAGMSPTPIPTTTAQASMDQNMSEQSSLSWSFLIVGILSVMMIIVGIIAMVSWKHQQLKKKMRVVLQVSGRMSLSDTILVAMGFDDQLFSLRIESDDVRVLHVLGKAGCGMLYLAEVTRRRSQFRRRSASAMTCESVGSEAQFVTLKKIFPELSAVNSPSLTLFLQEIQLMSRLEHPNIVEFIGVTWTTISDIAMVLEFVPNGDLGTLLRIDKDREQKLQSHRLHWFEPETAFASTMSLPIRSMPSKSAIALDILEALVYLHSFTSPVIHRELRAHNVLLSKNFDAKLCNFGAPSEWQVDTSRPESAESVAWIAPEILRGEAFSEKADMYSFGVVLAEMASCTRPFAGLLTAEIIFRVLTEDERPEMGSRCPEEIRHFALKCMHGDPSVRPSAQEAHQEFRSFRNGSRLSAL